MLGQDMIPFPPPLDFIAHIPHVMRCGGWVLGMVFIYLVSCKRHVTCPFCIYVPIVSGGGGGGWWRGVTGNIEK